MRGVATLAMVMLLVTAAAPARAQSADDPANGERRLIKVLIGAGALVAGTAVAANSSKSTRVSGTTGVVETSEFSKSRLITGVAVAGTGAILLWDGLSRDDPARPNTRFGVAVGRSTRALFVRRNW